MSLTPEPCDKPRGCCRYHHDKAREAGAAEVRARVEALAERAERRAAVCPCVNYHDDGFRQGPHCGNPRHAANLRLADELRAALTTQETP